MRDTSGPMSKALIAHVSAFAKVKVLVVGDLVADHYLFGQTERVSREAPVVIVRHEREDVKLGGAANAAANARALGAEVTALGILGADQMGAHLKALFQAAEIGLAAVEGPGLVTETKSRVLAGAAGTTRQQMLRIDRGVVTQPVAARERLVAALEDLLQHADVVVVSDYGAGVICDETRAVLRAWSKNGRKICADSRYALGAFASFTVCKPNEPELAVLTGMPVDSDEALAAAGQKALGLLDCETLLVTRGQRGMAVFERNQSPAFLPVHGVGEALDVTGAGDTVIATFALALGAGASSLDAARLANIAAAIVVQKPGTATVSSEELIAELQ